MQLCVGSPSESRSVERCMANLHGKVCLQGIAAVAMCCCQASCGKALLLIKCAIASARAQAPFCKMHVESSTRSPRLGYSRSQLNVTESSCSLLSDHSEPRTRKRCPC